MARILITGSQGYVASNVIRHLRSKYPNAQLIGFDIGYFSNCVTTSKPLPETLLDVQYFGDIRKFPNSILDGVDIIVHLAAISNDPMGKEFEEITYEVNHKATIKLAKAAKDYGVSKFIFASSCSVYGFSEEGLVSEYSDTNPLTAYAKSKFLAEQDLKTLSDHNFTTICLRFATACGASDRLRADLVVNDFTESALMFCGFEIKSDGTPWRPLIDTQDMARAIEWGISTNINWFNVVVNVGKENYQVKDIAEAIKKVMNKRDLPCEIRYYPQAKSDNRSYKVDFSLFQQLAPNHQSQITLEQSIDQICMCEEGRYFRLETLKKLQLQNLLNKKLEWN